MSEDDTNIIFFLGAGASVSAGLKTVVQLTDYFITTWLKDKENYRILTQDLIKKIADFEGKKSHEYVDIESVLKTIEKLEEYDTDIICKFVKNSNLIFNDNEKKIIRKKKLSTEIKKFIKTTFIKDMDTIDYLYPFDSFMDLKPLKIFSTNYDLTIERFCFLKGIKYTDGFDPYWNKNIFIQSDHVLKLYKLHGSVNWYRTESGDYFSIPIQTTDMDIELVSGEKGNPLILYPGNKLQYIEPVLEILSILRDSLLKIQCCFVVGYSFKDDHILKLFKNAIKINKDLIIILISPSAHNIYEEKFCSIQDNEFNHNSTNNSDNKLNKSLIHLNSELCERIIILPYKFEQIFPKLRSYYNSLKEGVRAEKMIYKNYIGVEPLLLNKIYNNPDSLDKTGHFYTEEFRISDLLKQYVNCEYFEKCKEIIKDLGGWKNFIYQDFNFAFELLIKLLLNRNKFDDNEYYNLLKDHLKIDEKRLDIQVNGDVIVFNFRLLLQQDFSIDGNKAYNLFNDLLDLININEKITQEDKVAFKSFLQKGKDIFFKWRNDNMALSSYKEFVSPTNISVFKKLLDNTDKTLRKKRLEDFIRKNEIKDK